MTQHTFVIAEMACSHEGDGRLARTIIDGAGQAGADAIQYQMWKLAEHVVPHHPAYPRLQAIELSADTWRELAAYARERYPAMEIIACVYERSSVDLGEDIGVAAYKLHSADLSNPYLVNYVAATGKRIDLSVGASTLDEIQAAVECIRQSSSAPIWLMVGYQNFPTRTDDVHLRFIKKLGELFDLPIGYQDHTDADDEAAFWLPAAAMGMGITVLEKHITHDRSLKGIDHEAALNPDEFARFVRMVRVLDGAKGQATPRPFSADEQKYRRNAKKSLVAARPLTAGKRLAADDLYPMIAEAPGVPPDQVERLLGRTITRDIPAYHLVREEELS